MSSKYLSDAFGGINMAPQKDERVREQLKVSYCGKTSVALHKVTINCITIKDDILKCSVSFLMDLMESCNLTSKDKLCHVQETAARMLYHSWLKLAACLRMQKAVSFMLHVHQTLKVESQHLSGEKLSWFDTKVYKTAQTHNSIQSSVINLLRVSSNTHFHLPWKFQNILKWKTWSKTLSVALTVGFSRNFNIWKSDHDSSHKCQYQNIEQTWDFYHEIIIIIK